MKKTSCLSYASGFGGLLLAFISIAPFGYVLVSSFLPSGGLAFEAYYDVFLGSPQYLLRFWKSMGLCLGIVASWRCLCWRDTDSPSARSRAGIPCCLC